MESLAYPARENPLLLKILACDLLPERGGFSLETKTHPIRLISTLKDVTKLQNYRDQVSIVSQDSHIFTASLAFNIAMELGAG